MLILLRQKEKMDEDLYRCEGRESRIVEEASTGGFLFS